MSVTYLDKIKYLYPGIQNVVYWQTQYDGKPWADLYDGIDWQNTQIKKPDKATLDAVDTNVVGTAMASNTEIARKAQRDLNAKSDLALVAEFTNARQSNAQLTLTAYLDSLEAIAAKL